MTDLVPHSFDRLDPGFWLKRWVPVVVDRPLGSSHPRYGYVYPLNYGFVPGTLSPDGDPVDAYVLGCHRAVSTCWAPVVAVVRRFDDVEDKLVVSLSHDRCDLEFVRDQVFFQEQFFCSQIFVRP